jgi:hypothetical protein
MAALVSGVALTAVALGPLDRARHARARGSSPAARRRPSEPDGRKDERIRSLVSFDLTPFDEAARVALAESNVS